MTKEGFIKIAKASIFFQKIEINKNSDSPTFVFLHDALGSTAQWRDFPEKLAQSVGLNAIVYDREGYGKSSSLSRKRIKTYLHEEAYNVLPAVLKELNINNPILVGHSDGGSIALLYAAEFDPVAIVCEAAHVIIEKETLEGIYSSKKEKDTIIDKLQKYHGEKTEVLFDLWANNWLDPEFRNWNIEHVLKKISCPALIIQGVDDEYASKDHVNKIVTGIGENAHSFLLKNCKHIPHKQAEEETLEKMSNFIQELI